MNVRPGGRGRPRPRGGDRGGGSGRRGRVLADVVDEEQHVRALVVAEGLGDGQAGQADAQAGAGRLGHLAVDQRGLALGARDRVGLGQVEIAAGLPVLVELLAEVDDLGLDELAEQVVPLAGALADAGEDREAAVAHRDVVDQLHDEHGLADARAAEEAGLAALGVGLEQVDDLDAGLEHLGRGGQLGEGRGQAVDRGALLDVERAHRVDGLADDVEDAAEDLAPDRRGDRRAGVGGDHAAHHALGGLHRDGAHRVLAEVLGDLEDGVDHLRPARRLDLLVDDQRVHQCRQLAGLEFNVDDRADHLRHAAFIHFSAPP